MAVAVVTDSTAYLPAAIGDGTLTVVPLHIVLGGVSGREGLDVSPAEVAVALTARRVSVTTSQPTPAEFKQVYDQLFAAGADGVVSVHLAGALSGTLGSAAIAAKQADGPVEVVDSCSAAMGVGFPALAAARAAAEGKDLKGVREAALATISRTSTFFYVDTLEHLRRGGRINAASALVGTALAVKPLLEVSAGGISMRDKVRTAARALDRLVALAVQAAGDGPVEVAVHHLAAAERAGSVAAALQERLGDRLCELYTSEVGAVVAAHVGPGLAGIVVHRLPEPDQSLLPG
ncbi:DegV family protein [Catellatospora tritici]|uniref:DegV family protein n=1 Tax=Catellatospora tritici TaxID=2851566 RepID=UPI001C2CE685|nr:DegV family protein [Catellatospora tritici]MBV1855665.1 DegV family protein [Catellatospora tritici]